jgi:tellurite resistance protein TehA-like permease
MLNKLSYLWKRWCEKGIHLPYAYDPETKAPSITLIFYWISSALSLCSLIAFQFQKVTLQATGMCLMFVVSAYVMYRLRKLDKVKIDVKNESVDLEDDDQQKGNS